MEVLFFKTHPEGNIPDLKVLVTASHSHFSTQPRLETEKSFITEERYPGKQQQQLRSKLHSNVKAVMPLKGGI